MMTWFSNVIVVGIPVDGMATVRIPLPGSDSTNASNLRETIIAVDLLTSPPSPDETPPTPVSAWLDNVIIEGEAVDGLVAVKIPLPGSNMLDESNFRETIVDVTIFEQTPVTPEIPTPPPGTLEYYPILSSVKW